MTFTISREIQVVQIAEGAWDSHNPLSVNNWISHEVRKTVINLNEDHILISENFVAQFPENKKYVKIGLVESVFVVGNMRGFPGH